MSLKFYTDTHIAKAVAVQLRERGIDTIRCEEVGLATAKDFEHLERATSEGRMVITNDRDFPNLHKRWLEENKYHAGIIYCLPHVQGEGAIGVIVQFCISLHELIEGGAGTVDDDIANQIFFVS